MSETSVYHLAGVAPQTSLPGPCPPSLALREGKPHGPPPPQHSDSVAPEPAHACEAPARWPRVFPGL